MALNLAKAVLLRLTDPQNPAVKLMALATVICPQLDIEPYR